MILPTRKTYRWLRSKDIPILAIREAVGDSVVVASAIVLFLIRFLIVMVPIFILIILPGGLLARYVVRRARRWKPASELQSTSESN